MIEINVTMQSDLLLLMAFVLGFWTFSRNMMCFQITQEVSFG